MNMYHRSFAVGRRIATRYSLLAAYRIVSEPTRELPSRSKYVMAVAAKWLIDFAPIVLTYLSLSPPALSETRPSVEAGGVGVGLIFCYYIVCTVGLHLIDRYIVLPYRLFTRRYFRWGHGIVYESEVSEYLAHCEKGRIWMTLSDATGAVTQINYAPPFPTKKEKIFKIIAALIGVLYFVLVYSSSSGADGEQRMMSIACLMASICFFVLTIIRTFKPEY